MKFAEECFKNS